MRKADPNENWIASPAEPGWQKGRSGKEYMVVWQPKSGARGFLGRDDLVYFDQDLTQIYQYFEPLPKKAQVSNWYKNSK